MSLMVLHTARAPVPVLLDPTGVLPPQQLAPQLCRSANFECYVATCCDSIILDSSVFSLHQQLNLTHCK